MRRPGAADPQPLETAFPLFCKTTKKVPADSDCEVLTHKLRTSMVLGLALLVKPPFARGS
jgi:hypothetical protein